MIPLKIGGPWNQAIFRLILRILKNQRFFMYFTILFSIWKHISYVILFYLFAIEKKYLGVISNLLIDFFDLSNKWKLK